MILRHSMRRSRQDLRSQRKADRLLLGISGGSVGLFFNLKPGLYLQPGHYSIDYESRNSPALQPRCQPDPLGFFLRAVNQQGRLVTCFLSFLMHDI